MTKEELISFLVSLGTERELSLLIAKRLYGEIYTSEKKTRVIKKYREALSEDTKEGIRNIMNNKN